MTFFDVLTLIVYIMAAIGWGVALYWKWRYDDLRARSGEELGFA